MKLIDVSDHPRPLAFYCPTPEEIESNKKREPELTAWPGIVGIILNTERTKQLGIDTSD